MHKNRNIVLLLFPFWLLIYYFKDSISYFLIFSFGRLSEEGRFPNAAWFFLNSLLKIGLLLIIIIFVMGVVRSYFSPEKTRKALEGKPLFAGNILAGLLGIVTPFCSCSAIPLFLGFVETGIPLGVTFSFLIAAPLINEVAVISLIGLFGWKTGLIYIISGLVIAVAAGWIIGRFKLEKWVQDWVLKTRIGNSPALESKPNLENRIKTGFDAVNDILSKIWIYLTIGIAVGALVHGYVPNDFFASALNKSTWYTVPLAVLVGTPLYSCTAGAVPVAFSLIEKGVPLGTALAFMMSVIGISLPELIILKKVLKLPLILTFVGVLAVGIMLVGYLFNMVL
jgi:uncharacterized membrane protein YraQ (UPF0718 family)